MAWFFHVVELPDGSWACRRGTREFDVHAEFDDAVRHITAIASNEQPAEIYLHRRDGTTELITILPADG